MNFETLPFAGDPVIGEHIKIYRDAFKISTCIETGTQFGHTTRALAHIFNRVITAEINQETFDLALRNLDELPNVQVYWGPSETMLNMELEAMNDRPENHPSLFFYLDAHGPEHGCPLRAELDAIARHRSGRSDVILIHDFKVPDRPELGFDIYNEKPIDLALVQDKMDKIWPDGWTVRYNDMALGAKRGCAYFTTL